MRSAFSEAVTFEVSFDTELTMGVATSRASAGFAADENSMTDYLRCVAWRCNKRRVSKLVVRTKPRSTSPAAHACRRQSRLASSALKTTGKYDVGDVVVDG